MISAVLGLLAAGFGLWLKLLSDKPADAGTERISQSPVIRTEMAPAATARQTVNFHPTIITGGHGTVISAAPEEFTAPAEQVRTSSSRTDIAQAEVLKNLNSVLGKMHWGLRAKWEERDGKTSKDKIVVASTSGTVNGERLSKLKHELELLPDGIFLYGLGMNRAPLKSPADLEPLSHFRRLARLSLSGARLIGPSGRPVPLDPALEHISGCGYLRFLDLSDTKLTGHGLRQIAGLTGLKELYVRENPAITDSDLVYLSGMQELEELDLVGTGITDAAHVELSRLRGLRTVRVSGSLAEPMRSRLGPQVRINGP